MDTRTTSADFYPGGKTPVTAGGGITSGETGGAAGEPMVPVTKVDELPEHYRESDMRSKINELARVISGGVAAIMAMVSLTLGAEPVKVLGAKKDALWNDDFVVTNVVADFAGFATTNTVTGATNALATTFVRGLEVATNAVLQAGAKEIAAATNALSQSVDERLKASTNGSFSASSLEPYAKRTWVEAQGYLKSTNLTGYAQVDWVQNQGFIKKENASGEIARIVDEKIAAQDKTAAYRLMAADGTEWIDGTGVCWKVQSCIKYFTFGRCEVYGKPDQKRFTDDRGSEVWLVEETEDEWTWAGRFVLNEHELEDGDVVAYYEGVGRKGDANIELGFKEYVSANTDYYQYAVSINYSVETNIIDRVAYTSDVAKVNEAATTNDVCKIVTNEVAEWVCDPSEMYGRKISVVWYDSEESAGWYPAFDGEMYINSDPRNGDGDTFRWIANRNWDQPFDLVATRKKSNALGLARLSDLSDYVTTNDVRNIVTNKTEYSQWKLSVDIPENALIPADVIQFLSARLGNVGVEFGEDKRSDDDYYRAYWCLNNLPDIEGWWSPPTDYDVKDRSDTNLVWQAYVNDMDNKIISIRGTRELQNTLGLATLKDIEKLPDHETVTNIAKGVVDEFGPYRRVYYVTTNTTINVDDEEKDPFIDELFGGIAFDLYQTNAAYFIDGDIPTLKLLAPHRRSVYFGNQFTAVEIGDEEQLLRTHILQADGGIAVRSPENIRFMGTLNRDSYSGTTLSLEDYLEAVAQNVQGMDVKAYNSFTVSDGKDGGDVFTVTKNSANFMNSLEVKPNVGPYLYYPGQTNEQGVVTNYNGYAETNSHVKVKGNMHVTDSVAVSSNLTVWGKVLLSSWENLRLAWPAYKDEINSGIDCGKQVTLAEYVEQLTAPIIAATNEYAKGDSYVMVTNRYQHGVSNNGSLPLDFNMLPHPKSGTNATQLAWHLVTRNKRNYIVKMDVWRHAEFFVDLSGDEKEEFYHNKFVLDSTLGTHTNYVNLGFYNFKGMGNEDYNYGMFETIYSNVEPIERTEAVLRTETWEYENWIWDDESGNYILDPDEPYITETYEWWDEYTFDMVWAVEPGTIWEYDITRAGETALRVNVQRIYKTTPYAGTGN